MTSLLPSLPPIDLVFSYVDGHDPVHMEERARYLGKRGISKSKTRPTFQDKTATANFRWTDHHELYYAILSARRYAPWLRHIFVVVSLAQRPKIPEATQVIFVDDCQILPETCLPTFNSHALEANLHRIPGLAEHFLYANDDMFFLAPVLPMDFFGVHTKTQQWYPRYLPGELLPDPKSARALTPVLPGWYSARLNNAIVLDRLFPRKIGRKPNLPRRDPKHQIRPVLKSVWEWMWKHPWIGSQLTQTTATRFRHFRNLEPVGLATLLAIEQGKSAPASILKAIYISLQETTDLQQEWTQIKNSTTASLLCLNDNGAAPDLDLQPLFQALFPVF